MNIPITCKGSTSIPLEELNNFQGNLKSLPQDSLTKLKKSILKHGFSFPVFVWGNSIIDGHQRTYALSELIKEGYSISALPVVEIEAKDKKEAAEKLLVLNSQYAKITQDGMMEFVDTYEIDLAGLTEIEIPNIEISVPIAEELGESENIESRYMIVIDCNSESEQLEFLEKFQAEGVKCKALIS